MPAALVAALLVVPLVELYVLIQVGQVVGALWTVAALVVVSVLGAALLRREGARTWHALTQATARGRVPANEVADGAMVLFAGALLLTPGFVSDVVGFLLLLPPVRAVLRGVLMRYAARRMLGGLAGPFGPGPARPPGGSGRVVDGEVDDRDPGP